MSISQINSITLKKTNDEDDKIEHWNPNDILDNILNNTQVTTPVDQENKSPTDSKTNLDVGDKASHHHLNLLLEDTANQSLQPDQITLDQSVASEDETTDDLIQDLNRYSLQSINFVNSTQQKGFDNIVKLKRTFSNSQKKIVKERDRLSVL